MPPGKYDRKIKTQRNRRGLAQAVEHEVQFDTKRKTLPGFEMYVNTLGNRCSPLKDTCTGAAWLSSARALKCSLKWGNERNPHRVFDLSHETAQLFAQEQKEV